MVPTLIYDGRCGFCKMWVRYWQALTGEQIRYAASEEVAEQFPQISAEEFRRSVWLVYPDGERFRGAEAVLKVIAMVPRKRWPLRAYQHVPGFAFVAEAAYGVIARHRNVFYWITRILWGKRIEPASYSWTRSILLRGLGIVYLLAFASLLPQILGLVGARGILPAREYLESIRSQIDGIRAYWIFPTFAWLNSGDLVLRGMCWTGMAAAIALIFRIVPIAAVVGLYALYLSLDTVGQTFLSFQWDALLLEAGFAAILLAPGGLRPRYNSPPLSIGIWVMRFLAFRLMLESGIVKLLSGDPAWRNLTALRFHFETQPLPTPLAWYVHQLPLSFQKANTAVVFLAELAVPILFLMPRIPRIVGAWITIVFQLLIAATGNYTFFNVLTIVLCFSLFDDQHLRRFIPTRFRSHSMPMRVPSNREIRTAPYLALGLVLIAVGVIQLLSMFGWNPTLPPPASSIVEFTDILHVVNRYGLFAVMTTSRPEIVIEGSDDGTVWKAYEFKYKPGDMHRRPPWVAPYHPRLDWQMWFAALSNYRSNPWFPRFMARLLEGSPDVLELMGTNPFPDRPPRIVRAVVYDYHFSDRATRRATGAWWTRELLGSYFPAVGL